MPSQCPANEHREADSSLTRPDVMQLSTIAPCPSHQATEEREAWQAQSAMRLQGLEYDMYHHFVTTVSAWIDIFDPSQHFATLVPRLALRNEGLMKAILAMGARHMAASAAEGSIDVKVFKHAAVQYYSETLQYLQTAMRYASYKNSPELLATTLIISTYEMLDGAGAGWERHLKGVFWIQRTRETNGESGGLGQAVWWAWLLQDLWAAFRERRRVYSFYRMTKSYSQLNEWDIASRIIYILAQCVNFASDEEKRNGERNVIGRAARGEELAQMLEEWRSVKSISFEALPYSAQSATPFKPIWIHPPAFAVAMQMYHVARILIVSHRPSSREHHEDRSEDGSTCESIDVIGGIALLLPDGAYRALSSQCLYAAGLSCQDEARRKAILDTFADKPMQVDWAPTLHLPELLKSAWAAEDSRYR